MIPLRGFFHQNLDDRNRQIYVFPHSAGQMSLRQAFQEEQLRNQGWSYRRQRNWHVQVNLVVLLQ